VKINILTNEWRYKWVSIPQFEFTNYFEKCKILGFIKVLSIFMEVLLLHSVSIHQFTLCILKTSQQKLDCSIKGLCFYKKRKVTKFHEFLNQLTYIKQPNLIVLYLIWISLFVRKLAKFNYLFLVRT